MSNGSDAFTTINLADQPAQAKYKLITGSIVPRPIAWVSTRSSSGVVNVAPFSQFVVASYQPAILAISIGRGPRGRKDTLVNIEETGEFVVNLVPENCAEQVESTAEDLPRDVSEADLFGLARIQAHSVKVPRLAVSPVQFECRLHSIVPVGDEPNMLVLGQVALMHVECGLIRDGKIDLYRHRTLARLGGKNYTTIGEITSL